MTCTACGEHPKENPAKDFTKAVIEINNPETLVIFRKVVIPSSLGDDTVVPPAIGKYRNVLLVYEANNHAYLYSSDGAPTLLTSDVAQEIEGKIDTVAADLAIEVGNRQNADIALQNAIAGKQDTLTAGTNISISSNTISATDTTYSDFTGATPSVDGAAGLVPAPTTSDPDKYLKGDGTWSTPPGTSYSAGTGIDLTGTTFSVDTSTVAMQTDLPTVNDATLTIQQNGTNVATFTANASSNATANITAPVITLQTTDPGEGQPLAANNFIGVYNA